MPLQLYNGVAVLTTRSCYLYPPGRLYSSTDYQFTVATEIRCCRYKSLMPLQLYNEVAVLTIRSCYCLQRAYTALQIVSSLLTLRFVAVYNSFLSLQITRFVAYNYVFKLNLDTYNF